MRDKASVTPFADSPREMDFSRSGRKTRLPATLYFVASGRHFDAALHQACRMQPKFTRDLADSGAIQSLTPHQSNELAGFFMRSGLGDILVDGIIGPALNAEYWQRYPPVEF